MIRLVQSLFSAHNDRAVAITRWSEGPHQDVGEVVDVDIELDERDVFDWG